MINSMTADVLKKVPVREQDAKVRATNFEEVCLGYDKEEAMCEATRCINCKNAQCIKGCPVAINIPGFIEKVKEGDIEAAYQIISEASALPAVCGRVCPQESQCEGKCIRGIKGEPVSIGKLERFVADWARENHIKPEGAKEKKDKKVAVIGSGPAIWRRWDMMSRSLRHYMNRAGCLYMGFRSSVFPRKMLWPRRLRMSGL